MADVLRRKSGVDHRRDCGVYTELQILTVPITIVSSGLTDWAVVRALWFGGAHPSRYQIQFVHIFHPIFDVSALAFHICGIVIIGLPSSLLF